MNVVVQMISLKAVFKMCSIVWPFRKKGKSSSMIQRLHIFYFRDSYYYLDHAVAPVVAVLLCHGVLRAPG